MRSGTCAEHQYGTSQGFGHAYGNAREVERVNVAVLSDELGKPLDLTQLTSTASRWRQQESCSPVIHRPRQPSADGNGCALYDLLTAPTQTAH
jgi:hypothetical protein